MRVFLKRLGGFILTGSIPFILLMAVYVHLDPFRVQYEYKDYYYHNFITPNRGLVSLTAFKKYKASYKYNSFIFGNSRSQAFKIPEWEKHLDNSAAGFHFDASDESIYGIYHKMKFIQKSNIPLKNVLIVFDYEALVQTKNHMGFIFVSPPELSGESRFTFHMQFIKAYFDPVFLIGYLDYKMFHTYRDYMSFTFIKAKYDAYSDQHTNDLYYGNDRMISEDSAAYYRSLVTAGVFYDRKTRGQIVEEPVTPEQIKLLEQIKEVLVQENANYSVVISPMYNQQKLGAARSTLLNRIFGSQHVFDFSGVNTFTESMYNYYEALHFRPNVANAIMDSIYGKKVGVQQLPARSPGNF